MLLLGLAPFAILLGAELKAVREKSIQISEKPHRYLNSMNVYVVYSTTNRLDYLFVDNIGIPLRLQSLFTIA